MAHEPRMCLIFKLNKSAKNLNFHLTQSTSPFMIFSEVVGMKKIMIADDSIRNQVEVTAPRKAYRGFRSCERMWLLLNKNTKAAIAVTGFGGRFRVRPVTETEAMDSYGRMQKKHTVAHGAISFRDFRLLPDAINFAASQITASHDSPKG